MGLPLLTVIIMTDRTNYCTGCKDRQDRLKALTAENFKLAAGSCDVEGGKVGDEHGHFYCTLQAKVEALTADNEQWQVDYNEAVIDKLELETENHLLRVAAQRLGTYSAHDDDCRIMTHGVWSDPIPCTCGYTDAWQALAALEKKP